MKEKVILAYSGGLDTTAIIPWLKENYDYEVICCCIDCGQEEELDGLEERAISCGASKLYIVDIIDEFCDDYIMPCVQANAIYENKYLLGTSMARPLIAKKLVEIARKEGATAICHGATGKGNDQIRFELSIKALAPDLKIIAAWRDSKWTMDSRESEIEYCKAHGIHLPFSADTSYSRDRNIWHISHEGLELEDPACEPNYDHLLVLGVSPEKAPEYLGVMARPVVPVPGKKYKVTFWAKSSENSVVSVTLWGFSKGMKKELRVPNVFKITPEWKQFEFSYSVPSAAEDPVFAANPWYQFAFDLFRDKNKDFTFKDVKIEEEKQ